jgi:hypothetical protein
MSLYDLAACDTLTSTRARIRGSAVSGYLG